MTVKVINKGGNALPEYATPASAGMDVRASIAEAMVLKPLGRAVVPTGLFLEIPLGYEVQVRPRSGLAVKLCVVLVNLSDSDFTIEPGERIAQIVLARHETIEWEETTELGATQRGEGRFGSTGRK